jgi:two-component system nitrate/nitrite response regulator NarL
MREALSVLIVEPNSLFREGLCRILRAAHFRVASDAAAIDPILLEPREDNADLLLLIGAGGDHREAIRQIELFKAKYATGRVAVLADSNRPNEILAAFKSGANAYFMQSTRCDAFVRSLDLVMRGQTLIPAEILRSFMAPADAAAIQSDAASVLAPTALPAPSRPGAPKLSTQETRILQYLIEGHSNKVIARNIDIADATVKGHIKAILRKIQVHNRTQAAIWAMNNNSLHSGIVADVNGKAGLTIS